jgi:hypothetical protein
MSTDHSWLSAVAVTLFLVVGSPWRAFVAALQHHTCRLAAINEDLQPNAVKKDVRQEREAHGVRGA